MLLALQAQSNVCKSYHTECCWHAHTSDLLYLDLSTTMHAQVPQLLRRLLFHDHQVYMFMLGQNLLQTLLHVAQRAPRAAPVAADTHCSALAAMLPSLPCTVTARVVHIPGQ